MYRYNSRTLRYYIPGAIAIALFMFEQEIASLSIRGYK